jgi:hypothetical protein
MYLQPRKGTWPPDTRIEGLLRYAFIGDSMTYGTGVRPDQTLPAHAERQMNELLAGWPVEAVNLGVPGYNLWNSWLKFKNSPQVYDGVVLSLCHNDAEFFGVTLRVPYPMSASETWESSHPAGRAADRCFGEIAEFSARWSLPVAIVFYITHANVVFRRMSEIVAGVCAKHDLYYLDTWIYLRELKLAPLELSASAWDAHPSAKAHQIVGRNLVLALHRKGWFDMHADHTIEAAPDRIIKAAKAMVEVDHYSQEVACNWAFGVLEAKSRLAARLEAIDGPLEFSSAVGQVASQLSSVINYWHISHRLHALVQHMATHDARVADHLLNGIFFERQTVNEICFALEMDDWEEICAKCIDLSLLRHTHKRARLIDAMDILDSCEVDLQKAQTALAGLRAAVPELPSGWHGENSQPAVDLEIIESLLRRLGPELVLLRASFLRAQAAHRNLSETLSPEREEQLLDLLGQPLRGISARFSVLSQWSAKFDKIRDRHGPGFTTVQVTLRAEAREDPRPPLLLGRMEYGLPWRLPFTNGGSISRNGDPSTVKLTFPTLYSGRIRLSLGNPRQGARDFNLIKVEVYNCDDRRSSIDPALFRCLPNWIYESPDIYLF